MRQIKSIKASCLAASLLLSCIAAFSQIDPSEFGSVSVAELSPEPYKGDTASAIVLFDKGSVVVEPNSTIGTTFKRHMRIKIITKDAFDRWGSRKFFVSIDGQLKVRGFTYNLENGSVQKTELTQASIFRSKYNKYVEEINIAFPNVKEGSVVEFSLIEKNPDLYLPGWRFQTSIPTRWSEYTISVPAKSFIAHLGGSVKLTSHETKYDGKYQHWLMTNVPAFVDEPLMPDEDAYVAQLDFGTRFTSWLEIWQHLMVRESFSDIIHKHKYLKEQADEITAGLTEPRQKIKAISNYIKQEIKFNGVYDYYGVNPSDLFDKKSGTSGDINLTFASMLEKAGLKVNMVLLSTRPHGGAFEDFPSLSQFDYVVCEVALGEKELLVDATDKNLPYDMLPPQCLNHRGFLISQTQYGWVNIEPVQREKVTMDASFSLTPGGGITGKLKSVKEGYAAFDARLKYLEVGEKNYKVEFDGSELWNIQQSEVLQIKSIDQPVLENFDLKAEDYATLSGDLLYYNPHIVLREETNPFTLKNRIYPIDYGTLSDRTIVCSVTIPEGYRVEEIPKSSVIVLTGNAAKCTFSYSQSGDKIIAMTKLQLNKTLFQPNEYIPLKEFYDRVVAKKAENVVLKRVK